MRYCKDAIAIATVAAMSMRREIAIEPTKASVNAAVDLLDDAEQHLGLGHWDPDNHTTSHEEKF